MFVVDRLQKSLCLDDPYTVEKKLFDLSDCGSICRIEIQYTHTDGDRCLFVGIKGDVSPFGESQLKLKAVFASEVRLMDRYATIVENNTSAVWAKLHRGVGVYKSPEHGEWYIKFMPDIRFVILDGYDALATLWQSLVARYEQLAEGALQSIGDLSLED